jgi:hypothetical protein
MNPAPWNKMVVRIFGGFMVHNSALCLNIKYNKKGAG